MALVLRAGLGRPIRTALLAAGALMVATATAAAPVLSPSVAPDSVTPVLRSDLEGPRPALPPHADRAALRRFYAARDFRPAWIGNPATDTALAAIKGAAADGLDPARYRIGALTAPTTLSSAGEAAGYDLAVTASLLHYAHDLRRGEVDPASADKMVGIIRPAFDAAGSLGAALAGGDLASWLAALAPDHPEYAGLKAALARYRAIVAKGGWPEVPQVRKIELKPGTPQLPALERRLAATDPVYASAPPDDLDALEAAVRRFQSENGLVADGVVGRQTIATLNISAAERVAQIKANMERWRWLPHRFPPRYIAVNAADTTLKAVEDGKVMLTSRVITGKPKTPTAIFNADAIAVTVNPPWIVPSSIARNEIMPKLRRNPAYLSKHHMVIVGGQVRQLPGDDNALGYLKVEMPNRFTAYLHDTSSRSLFAKDERHLSHGCIRVQNIRPLVSWLLTDDLDKGLERIAELIATGATQKIALDKPVPVFVLYWTAIPRADGGLDFRPDVYGRDKRLIAAMAGEPTGDAAIEGVSGCAG